MAAGKKSAFSDSMGQGLRRYSRSRLGRRRLLFPNTAGGLFGSFASMHLADDLLVAKIPPRRLSMASRRRRRASRAIDKLATVEK
jgi:hypothetical protein